MIVRKGRKRERKKGKRTLDTPEGIRPTVRGTDGPVDGRVPVCELAAVGAWRRFEGDKGVVSLALYWKRRCWRSSCTDGLAVGLEVVAKGV